MSRGLQVIKTRLIEKGILFLFQFRINGLMSILLFAILMTPILGNSYSTGGVFWKKRTWSLRFTTAAQTISSGTCSGLVTVKSYDPNGTLTNVGSNLTVSLAGPGTMTFYSDSSCLSSITTTTILSGTNTTSFYFIDTSMSTATITTSANNFLPAAQNQTLSSGFVWTGGGGNANWSTVANWSNGTAAPGAADTAIFNSACSSNCNPTINSAINIKGLRIESGYAGTITQGSGVTITVGTTGWIQKAGTFIGSNAATSMSGPFFLSGGSFTATTNTWTHSSNFTISGSPTFSASTGTIYFNAASTISPGSIDYNNITFAGCNVTQNFNNGTMKVLGSLVISGDACSTASLNSGTIEARGSITASANGKNGSAEILINGTGAQTFTGGVPSVVPAVRINKASGTLTLSGTISVFGNYTYEAGTIDPATSTLGLYGASITPGSFTYNNVTIGGCNIAQTLNGNTMIVNGTYTVTGSGCSANSLNSGTIEARGNVATNSNGKTGNALVLINGTLDQTLSGSGSSYLGPVQINKASGNLTLSGTVQYYGNFTHTTGNVIPGASNTNFVTTSTITPGTMTFGNVTFSGCSANQNLNSGTMTVAGNLTFSSSGCSPAAVNSGNINVEGNVVFADNGKTGSAVLSYTGGANTTLTKSASAYMLSTTHVINKNVNTAIVSLTSNTAMSWVGTNFTVSRGVFNLAGYTFSLHSLLTVAVDGTLTCNAGSFTSGSLVNNGSILCP